MAPYWLNNSCNPFSGPNGSCTLGNTPVFAIDVNSADTVAAGLRFARKHNIRLSIKNTGHDYTGKSNGQGSLELWMHHLKDISFFHYNSTGYTGPAAKAGAGTQFFEVYKAASDHNVRVVGGYCPSVGMVGGYVQSGGHGPLAASYGLAADNTLEFEVVTVDGRHLVASPSQNSDLYWALSGGGAGTYAVVLSLTMKAHPDGPTAGASLAFANTDPENYWAGISAFQTHLLTLNNIPGLATTWGFDNQAFALNIATLPGGTERVMTAAFDPFISDLRNLNITPVSYNTVLHPNFYDHYQHYTFPPFVFATNSSVGGRLIPRATVQTKLPELIDVFRKISTDPNYPAQRISAISINVTHDRVGNQAGSNAVLPAWREALYTLVIGIAYDADASVQELQQVQVQLNEWQALFEPLTPGGGTYMNEATWDNVNWKRDYFGSNYERLLEVKRKWDPEGQLWQHTSVGADENWRVAADGRLCRLR